MASKQSCSLLKPSQHSSYCELHIRGQCEYGIMNLPDLEPFYSYIFKASSTDIVSGRPQIVQQGSKIAKNTEPKYIPVARVLSIPQTLNVQLKRRAASTVLLQWLPGVMKKGSVLENSCIRIRKSSQTFPSKESKSYAISPATITALIPFCLIALFRSSVMDFIILFQIFPQSAITAIFKFISLGLGSINLISIHCS